MCADASEQAENGLDEERWLENAAVNEVRCGYGDIEGVWMPPVTAHVTMTLRWGAAMVEVLRSLAEA